MDNPQPSAKPSTQIRTTSKISVEPERTYVYPARTNVEWEFYGPCLVCSKEMEYDLWFRTTVQSHAEEWIMKQFEQDRKTVHLSLLQGRRRTGYLSLGSLEGLVCKPCWKVCEQMRAAALQTKRERTAEKAREAREEAKRVEADQRRERERWENHATWREAAKSEFVNIPDGVARFAAELGPKRYKILFRWRPVGGNCRGDSPRNVVGMWVDGKFVTHYHGWNIAPLEGERPYFDEDVEWENGYNRIWPPKKDAHEEDVFALGFCRWLERAFQKDLIRSKPEATWRAKAGMFLDISTVEDIKIPCVLHTEWIDGSIYARILPTQQLSKLIAFAEDQLRMRIEWFTIRSA
jgi:hypothetical protein